MHRSKNVGCKENGSISAQKSPTVANDSYRIRGYSAWTSRAWDPLIEGLLALPLNHGGPVITANGASTTYTY